MLKRFIFFTGFNTLLRLQLLTCWLWAQPSSALATESVKQIASFPQWPGVSQLISYGNRIWFVNSQPFRDTNVADIYSYDPANKITQYERSLFTQDAGNPVVHRGLLYWPFEDPRRSAGAGEYAITDGENWQWHAMHEGRAMHVHAINVCDDQLVAVTGSWTGQFLIFKADNSRWNVEYDYPAAPSSFSRLVNVAQFKDQCIVSASANRKKEAKLFAMGEAGPVALAGWPVSDRVDGLTIHKDELFAFADTGNTRQLLRYNGTQTDSIRLPDTDRPRALHSNGKQLWLVTQHYQNENQKGQLWLYRGDGEFIPIIGLPETPISVSSLGQQVYIGGYNKDGGSLWTYEQQPKNNTTSIDSADTELKISTLASPRHHRMNEARIKQLYDELTSIIVQPGITDNYARSLRDSFARHPARHEPEFGEALSRLIDLPITDGKVTMFTRRTISRQDLIRWYVFNAMAINGYGYIDPKWINKTNTLDIPDSGKLFDPAVAAIVASGWINQNDKDTVSALLDRLNNIASSEAIRSDIIGALTAITGQRFGYDKERWNEWWRLQL